ncbi:MAG: hypothetical protein KC420_08100, partial [Myxococcales bacterium]|nr:hypothetical protein [Myxococcales bacterium]
IKFAFIRASDGTGYIDDKFEGNWSGALQNGLIVGAYQYFRPSQDPIAQANFLLDHTGPLQPGDLPPMIDVESQDLVGKPQYVDAVRAWLDHVEGATGVKPFIYTGYYYWKDYVGTDEFIDHPLWIANYNPGCPLIPDYWPGWKIHQFCACGDVAGIGGVVDSDNWNGGLDDLIGHTVGGAVCGDGKCVFGEDPYNCSGDCPPCGVIPPAGATIDNGDACYELYGDPKYWRSEAAGQGGSLVWTNATDFDTPSNYAIWRLYFEESGTYKLSTWIQQPFGETEAAVYRVQHSGGETLVPVNQSVENGWIDLGEYHFDAGANHSLRLDDNTGELNSLEMSIVCDALEVTRLDPNPDPTSTGGDSDGVDSFGNPYGTGGTDGGGTDGAGTALTATATATATDSATGLDADLDGDGQGCGCRGSTGGGSGAGALLALLLLVGGRRGRARARRTC